MPEPTSIRLSDDHLAWLRRYGGEVSEQMRADLDELRALLRSGLREVADLGLSESEASLICDVYISHHHEPGLAGGALPAIISEDVRESIALDGLGDKWDVDEDLPDRLEQLSPLGGSAVMHLVRAVQRGAIVADVWPIG